MTDNDWRDDDRLLADLGAALRRAEPVPEAVLAGARAAFSWRTVDAELAALSYDSLLDDALLVRGADAPPRILEFTGRDMSVEVELTAEALVGQLVPPAPGEVVLLTSAGEVGRGTADEAGCFTLPLPPAGPVRLQCETASARLATEWVTW